MKRRKFRPEQKASIALAALRGEEISKLSSLHQIHSNVITRWKNELENNAKSIFQDKRLKENQSKEKIIEELYRTIGKREFEISWLKKKYRLELPGEIEFD